MKPNYKGILLILGILAVMSVVAVFLFSGGDTKEIAYSDFLNRLEQGTVTDIHVSNYRGFILTTDGSEEKKDFPDKYDKYFFIDSRQEISNLIRDYNDAGRANAPEGTEWIDVNISFNDPNAMTVMQILYPVAFILGLAILAIFLFRSLNSGNRQAMNFAKSKARLNQNIKVRFNDVAGAEEEKEELKEVVEFLKNPKKFEIVGARIPKGVLLVGLPGTGKTLFAKAVAGEANVPFFSISGSDFVEMFVGVGASRVRDLFEDAKKYMPCIIFIDEIDAVGRQRGTGLGGGHDEREQTLNQLLVQMDGFETNSGIIIMAATNRADILDPALLRPGRFDRQIHVHLPDVKGREEIFKVHSRNKPISPEVSFKSFARITSGFSGADIENLLNEAAILAARDNRTVINSLDINEGINKVILGPQKKSRIVTEVDKRITAYHEAGHAIVAKCLPNCDPVHEVSIIQRGAAAGYTMLRPDTDDNHDSMSKLMDDIAMTMGGRAAEELVIKDITSGAAADIKRITDLSRRMVTEWGMSTEIGPVYLGSSGEVFLGRDYSSTTTYSESVATTIDREVKAIIDKGHNTAVEILSAHREAMDKMVRLLIERETIYTEEVDACMTGIPLPDIIKALDERLMNRSKKAQGKE